MTEPTNKQIQERHDEDQAEYEFIEHEAIAMQSDPDVDFEVSYSGADQAHKDRGILLKRLEAESELNALARKELCVELEAAEKDHLETANDLFDAMRELEAAEEKLKNMPCYREWMLDADGLSGISCADEAYVHDPLCPVCKATMEDK